MFGGVTDVRNMFQLATAFNQNIGSWNVGNVTHMAGMLHFATAFDQDIGSWNVGGVTDMGNMFFCVTCFVMQRPLTKALVLGMLGV
jgi:surface protein